MTDSQAVIIATGIALAGLFNGGIWSLHNETGWMLNRFMGSTGFVGAAHRRQDQGENKLYGVPAER